MHIACMKVMRNSYNIVGKCESRYPGTPGHRWEGNAKMVLKVIWCKEIQMVQDRVQWRGPVNTVMNLRVS
jgi:hypothetical protein